VEYHVLQCWASEMVKWRSHRLATCERGSALATILSSVIANARFKHITNCTKL
jgi:hypothetical protein